MTTREYYEVACYSLYQNYKEIDTNSTLDVDIHTIEEYIQKIPKNIMFYYKAGSISASLLSKVGFSEYINAAGGIAMFEDLIGLNKDEEYDRDILREYFSNMSKSKLVELCIKLALGDQKTLDEMLEDDWDK